MEIREATLAVCGNYQMLGTLGNTDMKFKIMGVGESGVRHLVAAPNTVLNAKRELEHLERMRERLSTAERKDTIKAINVDGTVFGLYEYSRKDTTWNVVERWEVLYINDVFVDATMYEDLTDKLFDLIELTKRNE